MNRRKKQKFKRNTMFQVVSQPFGFEGKMRLVFKIFDFDNHQLITFDKKRGKQVWNYAHNQSLCLSVPSGAVLCPNLIMKMKKIYKK